MGKQAAATAAAAPISVSRHLLSELIPLISLLCWDPSAPIQSFKLLTICLCDAATCASFTGEFQITFAACTASKGQHFFPPFFDVAVRLGPLVSAIFTTQRVSCALCTVQSVDLLLVFLVHRGYGMRAHAPHTCKWERWSKVNQIRFSMQRPNRHTWPAKCLRRSFLASNEYDAKPRTYDVLTKHLSGAMVLGKLLLWLRNEYANMHTSGRVQPAFPAAQYSTAWSVTKKNKEKIERNGGRGRGQLCSFAHAHVALCSTAYKMRKWNDNKARNFLPRIERTHDDWIPEFNQCNREHLHAESRLETDTRELAA